MTFTIKIKCENAAFEDADSEVARILKDVARRLEKHGQRFGQVHDINGNNVGSWGLR